MKKLFAIVAAMLLFSSVAFATPPGQDKEGAGIYVHSVTGNLKYFDSHPGVPSQWTLVGNDGGCVGGLCGAPAVATASGSLTLNHSDKFAFGIGDFSNGAGGFYVVGGEFNGSYTAHAQDWKSGGHHGVIDAQADGNTSGVVFTSNDHPDVTSASAYTSKAPNYEAAGAKMQVTERSRGQAQATADYDGAKTIWGFPSFGGIRGTYASIYGNAFAISGAGATVNVDDGASAFAGGINTVKANYWGIDIGFDHASLDGGVRAYGDTEAHAWAYNTPDYKEAGAYGFTYNRGAGGVNSADMSNVSTHGSGVFVTNAQVTGEFTNGYGAGSASTYSCFEYSASNPTYVNERGVAGGNSFTKTWSTGNGVAGYSESSSYSKTNY